MQATGKSSTIFNYIYTTVKRCKETIAKTKNFASLTNDVTK